MNDHFSDDAGNPGDTHELGVNQPEVITTPEGFRIHGRNETSLIRSLTSLNGIPIVQLESKMRPAGGRDSMSLAGFLGLNESLTEVLADDNETVLGMGLTHQKLGDFLHKFDNAPGELIHGLPAYGFIEVEGIKFAHVRKVSRGDQHSPFEDGTYSNIDHIVINLETGAGIEYSGLLPEMIHRYGFYEGKGTGYRLDPKAIAEVAGFIPPPPDDPIIQLIQNRDAQVEITTTEQLARVKNLNSAKVDILSGQNYRIVPEDLDTLLSLSETFAKSPNVRDREESESERERREQIIARVDTQRVVPQPYHLGRNQYTLLTTIIPSDFPEFEQTIVNNLEELQLMRGDASKYAVKRFITEILQGITQKDDGQDSPHKAYFEALLQKLPKDRQTLLQLYEATAGLYKPPGPGNTEALILIDALDKTLPSFKADMIALFKQFGIPVSDDATLEQLTKEKGNMEKYQKTLSEATRFVTELGGIHDALQEDIGRLVGIIINVNADPNHEYTPDEVEVLTKLQVTPELLRYAFQVISEYRWSPEAVVAQLYNGSARKEQAKEQRLSELPGNINEQARAVIQKLIEFHDFKSSTKVDINDFIGIITAKAHALTENNEGEEQAVITEADVLNEYASFSVPSFKDFLSHPLIKKSVAQERYATSPIDITLNPEVLQTIPDVEIKDPVYGNKTVKRLTIGDQTYTIDEHGIIKGEYKRGSEMLHFDGDKLRLYVTHK